MGSLAGGESGGSRRRQRNENDRPVRQFAGSMGMGFGLERVSYWRKEVDTLILGIHEKCKPFLNGAIDDRCRFIDSFKGGRKTSIWA
jgi:hypothetical protein